MSNIKTDTITPLGSTITVAGGITVGSNAYFSKGATFASGVTFGSTVYFSQGVSFASGITVADFTTSNVPAKPTTTELVPGEIVPLLSINPIGAGGTACSTAALPAGTWFVHLKGVENSPVAGAGGTRVDEDTMWVMAKTWTVPASQYLTFIANGITAVTANSGVSYRLGLTQSITFAATLGGTGNGFVILSESAGNATVIGNQAPYTAGNNTGVVYTIDGGSDCVVNLSGYAWRIS